MSFEIKEERITPQWMNTLGVFIGEDGNAWAIKKEQAIEENIINMLRELGIQASVKSDRYSLPPHGVVKSSNGFDSYVPAIYDSSNVKRKLLKVILNEDCRKIRFYVYIHTTEVEKGQGFKTFFGRKLHIEIRYYLHD
jgi:hypothetical protein